MTQGRQSLGRAGEACAARFLEARGYRIVASNVRADRVEIDLVAVRGSTLAFIEVKSRRRTGPEGFGGHRQAAEAVDPRKQARLRRGARAWLAAHPLERRRSHRVRFDVITCVLDGAGANFDRRARSSNDGPSPDQAQWSIEHWEAAF